MVACCRCNEQYVIERAINFVGRSEEESDPAARLTDQLQEVQRPSGIDGEIVARISEAGRNGDLSSKVKDRSSVRERLPQARGGLHVCLLDLHLRAMRRSQPAQRVLGS